MDRGRTPGQSRSSWAINRRAASTIEPDSDGYTDSVCARSVTEIRFCTASAIGRISSEAIGATTTPPITTPVAGRQKIFTNPCRSNDILARALVLSGSINVRAATLPSSIAFCGIPTAPISGRVNVAEATVRNRIGDDVCLVDMFTFVDGTIAEDDASDISFSELGAITATLHEHVQHWQRPESFTRFRWDLDTMLGAAGRWGNWRDAPALSAADAAVIEQAERKVIERLTEYGMGSERFGLVHADLRMSNLMVQDGKITVIDFDDCGWSWYLADLGAVVSFVEDTPDAARIVDEWLAGYRSVRDIPAADLVEIPTFVMLRRLMLTAWIGTHPESGPAQTLGHRFASGTAQLAQSYLTDPSWFRVSALTAH